MYPDEDDFEEVYNGNSREDLVDNDEMSAEEEAFMMGYDEDNQKKEGDSEDDKAYDAAFQKKGRRSKRNTETFDEAEIEAEVVMR